MREQCEKQGHVLFECLPKRLLKLPTAHWAYITHDILTRDIFQILVGCKVCLGQGSETGDPPEVLVRTALIFKNINHDLLIHIFYTYFIYYKALFDDSSRFIIQKAGNGSLPDLKSFWLIH